MKTNKGLLAGVIILVLLGAFGAYQYLSGGKNQTASVPETEISVTPTVTVVTPEVMEFEGKAYTLTAYLTAAGTMQKVPANIEVTATFDQGQVSGKAACNNYNGSYTVSGKTIQFGQMSTTMMACPDEQVMQQEAAYLAALEKAATFTQTKTNLELRDGSGAMMVQYTVFK